MLSPNTRRHISRIIPFGLIWLVFSAAYSLIAKGILGDATFYPNTNNPYFFSHDIIVTMIGAAFTGLVIGLIETLYLNELLAKKSFGRKLIYKTVFYLVIMITFLGTLTMVINAIDLQTKVFDEQVLGNLFNFLFGFSFWSVGLYVLLIIGVSLFYAEVSDNLGHQVLINFFTGKYHLPKEEERVFMFSDMKSSTTIAEKLGHVRYFEMLKEYYADLSGPIVQFSGEIDQYVGDEIVVSWKLKNHSPNSYCIQCFFAMKSALQAQKNKYLKKYGVHPDFRTGFHYGKVTTGEIGVVKKDIIFTGDVLNTTSRIQELCKEYQVDLLISKDLVETLDLHSEFKLKALGATKLRGREETIELYTIL